MPYYPDLHSKTVSETQKHNQTTQKIKGRLAGDLSLIGFHGEISHWDGNQSLFPIFEMVHFLFKYVLSLEYKLAVLANENFN